MATSEPKTGGVIDSAKRVGESALALLQNRLQLFAVELQEEKYRALQALIWLTIALALIFLGLAMGAGTLALLVWNQWGVLGLAGLTLLLLAGGVVLLAIMWNRLKSGGAPFSGTIQELKKDGEWLRRKH
jgi:uncharacterized membrane protein YqjE